MSAWKSDTPEAADPTPLEPDRTLGGGGGQPRGTSGLVRLLTVRNSLLAIGLITTSLLLWLVISFWTDAYTQRRDAEQILASTELGSRLHAVVQILAAERLLTHAALHSPNAANAGTLDRIAEGRARGNEIFDRTTRALRAAGNAVEYLHLVSAMEHRFGFLAALRIRVDRELKKAFADRNGNVLRDWFPGVTALIADASDLQSRLRYRPAISVAEIEAQLDLTHTVFVLSEYAERERAIIAGKIAAAEPLALEDVIDLSKYRGHFEEAWDKVETYVRQNRAAEEVARDSNQVRDGYFGTYEHLRTKITQAGTNGTDYPLTLDEWMIRSEAAIAPIRGMGGRASLASDKLAGERAAHGLRRLIIDSFVLVATLAIGAIMFWTVLARIIRPLERITVAMTTLAAGDESVVVPATQRRGEIGDMARAVQVFKETVERQTREVFQINKNLQELNENLESVVKDRTAEAEAARDEAIEANLAKSNFLANMSHELRTPLNAIIGYSEILHEEAQDLGHEDYLPDLAKIQSAGRHLLSLINDVLDISKIEAGMIDIYLEEFDITETVQDVAVTVGPLVEQNGNKLDVVCPQDIGAMHSDLIKVRQSLINILSNACKFTQNGTITLSVSRESRDQAEWISFAISDAGIGMTKDQVEKVFGAFTQADSSTTRQFGGTGLGLAITRTFCNLLGGDISATSEPGEGSTFTILLPAQVTVSPAYETKAPGDTEILPSWAKKVLVIDDDPGVRDLLTRHLTHSGYRVTAAASGDEGLRAVHESHPDAITLDVLMPNMDGWTVLNRLKDDPETANIPVIVISMLDSRDVGFSLGAADYLPKPVSRERLISTLQTHCPDRATKRRVLIVEDDEATRDVMGRMLINDDWEVDEAPNGQLGLDHIAVSSPDIIILDLMMPIMDGFEFLGEMRKMPDWADIPVVVVTAKNLSKVERDFLDERVEELIEKGDHLDSLLAALSNLLPDVSTEVRNQPLAPADNGTGAG